MCASLVLRRPLAPYYLTYLIDDLPFTAVVEMTALVDPAQLGGHTLVYLPKYVGARRPAASSVPDDEIEAEFLAGLQRVYPAVDEPTSLGVRVSRVRAGVPDPDARLLASGCRRSTTSVPGLHLVTLGADRQRHAQRERDRRARRAAARSSPAPAWVRCAHDRGESTHEVDAMKPLASLSLDADNQWSYLKIHGDDGWEAFPSYLDVLVPRALERARRATTCASRSSSSARTPRWPRTATRSRALAAAGHEIGNHSFRHEPWLHRYSEAELDEELAPGRGRDRGRDRRATRRVPRPGLQPVGADAAGARAPGLRVRRVARCRPCIGPLARAYYFRHREARPPSSGPSASCSTAPGPTAAAPLRPYRWAVGDAHAARDPGHARCPGSRSRST